MFAVHYVGQFEHTTTQFSPDIDNQLTWQLLNYWQDCRGDRDLPTLSDIDSDAIGQLWPHCFILDTRNAHSFPYFH
ncbi:MAG TPA: PAS domain-containing protein [Sneathiellales bacterium]|nr:PAS domain-containing protein [Sneathiellales bacterium]